MKQFAVHRFDDRTNAQSLRGGLTGWSRPTVGFKKFIVIVAATKSTDRFKKLHAMGGRGPCHTDGFSHVRHGYPAIHTPLSPNPSQKVRLMVSRLNRPASGISNGAVSRSNFPSHY
jgi:hypothetical protein